MLQNILGCCVWKMYTNLRLWLWIPLASAVALSSVRLCVHACRRNLLQHHVFISNGWPCCSSGWDGSSHFSFHLTACPSCPGWNSLLFSLLSEPCPMFNPTKSRETQLSQPVLLCLPVPARLLWHRGLGESLLQVLPLLKGVTVQLQPPRKWILNPIFDRDTGPAPGCSVMLLGNLSF